MPEAFTYWDMERRVRKAIPKPQQFSLEIHPEFGEREAITDEMKPLRGATKAKAMRDFPEQFQPKPNSTFFNFDQLPLEFRNKPILMSPEDMGSHGKSFYFHFGGGWYVQCQLRLHGHVLVMQRKELEIIKATWGGPTQKHEYQLALVNEDVGGVCIVVCDKNMLTTFRFAHTTQLPFQFTREALKASALKGAMGFCPIKERESFIQQVQAYQPSKAQKGSIYRLLCHDTILFNGIGTSHACEILHLACLHPLHPVQAIFADPLLHTRLTQGLQRFFDLVEDKRYAQFVPAGRSGGAAFHEPFYITQYINQNFLKVYRHTKTQTKIPNEHYEQLLALGYLDAAVTNTASRRKESQLARQLPVYAVVLRKRSGGPASYMYTVICEAAMKRVLHSSGAAVEADTITYLDEQDAWTKGTDARRGIQEIGIASFMGNNLVKKAELAAVKPQPIREGKVGRPRKSKIPAHHSTYRGIQKDGRYEVMEPVGPAVAELDAMDLDTVELQENGLLGPNGLQEPFGVAEGDEMELEGLEALNRFPLH